MKSFIKLIEKAIFVLFGLGLNVYFAFEHYSSLTKVKICCLLVSSLIFLSMLIALVYTHFFVEQNHGRRKDYHQ